MKASSLRKELHETIDQIQDQSLLEAVYVILNRGQEFHELSPEQELELKSRLSNHESGKTKSTPWKKSIKSIKGKIRK